MHRLMHRGLTLSWLLAMTCLGTAGAAPRATPLEQTTCGLKEAFVFWLWSSAAGKPDAGRLAGSTGIEPVKVTAADGHTLHGYRYRATQAPTGPERARGYLLVVQGNATLADRLIGHFQPFAAQGYDVYVFDYRGYGRSEGKRRLQAILNDYRQIIRHLDAKPYGRRAFYGISLGGLILLDALQAQPGEHTVAIDSTPSRLSGYGCPASHDPVNNLPEDAGRLLVIAGARDTVVRPAASGELLERAEARGATVLRAPDWGHPFMDGQTVHRLETVRRFLLQE